MSINLIVSKSVMYPLGGSNLEGEVKKLWDLETLGISEEENMHEPLFDNISVNGTRYPFSFPGRRVTKNFLQILLQVKLD